MAATAGRDCLYSLKGRMRVSVYKKLGIDYFIRIGGLIFVNWNGVVLVIIVILIMTISLALEIWYQRIEAVSF